MESRMNLVANIQEIDEKCITRYLIICNVRSSTVL